jgi:hypothetical protein
VDSDVGITGSPAPFADKSVIGPEESVRAADSSTIENSDAPLLGAPGAAHGRL